MPLRVVRAVDGIAQRWRNGGGTTLEVARAAAGAAAWRLSRAEIAHDGPFSAFPDLQRLQLLCRGRGFVLAFPTGEAREVLPAADALAYAGVPAPDCRLIDGPCEALNLLWDARRLDAAMQRIRLEGGATWVDGTGLLGVHVIAGRVVREGGDGTALRAGDSLLRGTQTPAGVGLEGRGEIAVVRLWARSGG